MTKIFVSLFGGLGNQLFQYATARAISERIKSELIFDLTWFDQVRKFSHDTIRCYALHPFNIDAKFEKKKHNTVVRSFFKRMPLMREFFRSYYVERTYCYDPNLLKINSSVWLSGYWQSQKYFEDAAEIIRSEIGRVGKLSHSAKAVYDQICVDQAVAVHIRRGDYISNSKAQNFHGLCSMDYYVKSIDKITKNLKNPHLYIFSDDPDWTYENFDIDISKTIVNVSRPDEAHQDLWLMSACKYFVIANSTFSWWGAWLGSYPNKRVIAPKRWFRDPSINTKDLIPSDWLQL